MLYDYLRLRPTPNEQSNCPLCQARVVAKCGSINTWHWAHKVDEGCKITSKEETEWHRKWKMKFPEEAREVICGDHIADVKIKKGVIEFQRSSISPEEIQRRESYYGDMVWVLNGADFYENMNIRDKGDYYTFRWRWPRKTWAGAQQEVVIDGIFENGDMLVVKKMYPESPCGGWGKRISRERFIKLVQ